MAMPSGCPSKKKTDGYVKRGGWDILDGAVRDKGGKRRARLQLLAWVSWNFYLLFPRAKKTIYANS